MQSLTVYDPAMCCSSGVCGPELDPKLVQFASDLDWLKGQGIKVERINLAQEPARFAENDAIKAILERSGGNDLPAIVVNGSLVANGRYPSREELTAFLEPASETASPELSEQMKELVALGAAIGASCEPCFKFHYDKSKKLGIPSAAMREAIAIGEAVKAASAKNIMGLANRLTGATDANSGPANSCGSGKSSAQKTSSCC